MEEKWKDDLRKSLADYESVPPAGLWESLSEALPHADTPAPRPAEGKASEDKHRPFGKRKRYWTMAAAVLALISVGIGIRWLSEKEMRLDDKGGVLAQKNDAVGKGEEALVQDPGIHSSAKDPMLPGVRIAYTPSRQANRPQTREEYSEPAVGVSGKEEAMTEETSTLGFRPDSHADSGNHSESEAAATYPNSVRADQDSVSSYTPAYYARESRTGKSPNRVIQSKRVRGGSDRFSIGLLTAYTNHNSTGGGLLMDMGPSSAGPGGDEPPDNPDGPGYGGPGFDSDSTESRSLILLRTRGEDGIFDERNAHTETSHSIPVRVGLTMQYRLTGRLALETGLTYTYLSSRQTATWQESRAYTRNRLHYIGIPLTLKYRFASLGPVDFYLSGGGAVDKCIYGEKQKKIMIPGSVRESQSSVSGIPLQWSVTGAVGVQYRPLPLLGIYVEPGAVYYPPAHSKVPTYFEDYPWNFNLLVGIRFILP